MKFKLRIWRQKNPKAKGRLVGYEATEISPNTSLLEMLDIVNEGLVVRGEEPIAFDSDCREGICGTCSLTINGEAHGPNHPGAACEVYMRSFKDGETIVIVVQNLVKLDLILRPQSCVRSCAPRSRQEWFEECRR